MELRAGHDTHDLTHHDMTACPSIDTSPLVTLLGVHRQMKRSGRQLLLRRPSADVERPRSVARVNHVFTIERLPTPGR
ncbi:STAS domain-containing protein [Actinoplanes sp. NPDC026623]|uniref:STAS domain-containing protein n=1 Tax=Actinoplanes sp. NPDC026623 TaxID=3155610 RepID=UPI0033FD7845